METKKTQQLTKPVQVQTNETQQAASKAGTWLDFFGDIKAEFLKISWTSPEELRTYTKIVVGMTVFLGLGIYGMDLFIQTFLGVLQAFMRWIS